MYGGGFVCALFVTPINRIVRLDLTRVQGFVQDNCFANQQFVGRHSHANSDTVHTCQSRCMRSYDLK